MKFQDETPLLFFESVFTDNWQLIAGNPRQKAIDAVLERANAAWRVRYESFILDFAAAAAEPFTAEDVREAYLSEPGPRTGKEQASGGIFRRLVHEGKLRKVGKRLSRKYGNELTTYHRGTETQR